MVSYIQANFDIEMIWQVADLFTITEELLLSGKKNNLKKKKEKQKKTVGLRKITLKLTYWFIFFKCENAYTNAKLGPSYTHSESA